MISFPLEVSHVEFSFDIVLELPKRIALRQTSHDFELDFFGTSFPNFCHNSVEGALPLPRVPLLSPTTSKCLLSRLDNSQKTLVGCPCVLFFNISE